MNLSISPISNKNINFQHKTSANIIRDIPHLTCASCGREMIRVEDFYKVLGRVTLPLKNIIKMGGVNYFGTSAAKVSYLGVSYLNMQ